MDTQQKRYDELKHRADVSVRYHSRRQGFYNFCHKLAMLIVVLGGSASAVAFFGEMTDAKWSEKWMLVLPVLVTLVGLLDAFFEFANKEAVHWLLRKQFTQVEKRLVEIRSSMTEVELNEVETDMLRIESDEPRTRRVVHAICYNEVLIAWDRDKEYLVPITFMQRIFANFFDWRPSLLDR